MGISEDQLKGLLSNIERGRRVEQKKVVMPVHRVEIPIVPIPKPRMVKSDAWKKRPVVERYWRYKDSVLGYCKGVGFELNEVFSATFVMPMPKGWCATKLMEKNGKPCREKRPDLDNLVKAISDILMEEDKGIWRYEKVQKLWGYEGKIIIDNVYNYII